MNTPLNNAFYDVIFKQQVNYANFNEKFWSFREATRGGDRPEKKGQNQNVINGPARPNQPWSLTYHEYDHANVLITHVTQNSTICRVSVTFPWTGDGFCFKALSSVECSSTRSFYRSYLIDSFLAPSVSFKVRRAIIYIDCILITYTS